MYLSCELIERPKKVLRCEHFFDVHRSPKEILEINFALLVRVHRLEYLLSVVIRLRVVVSHVVSHILQREEPFIFRVEHLEHGPDPLDIILVCHFGADEGADCSRACVC